MMTIAQACRGVFLFSLLSLSTHLRDASAATYDVSASDGMDLAEAMSVAEAGDTINLGDGVYDYAVVSVRDGAEGRPITIVGSKGAVIKGDYSSRSVLIHHSFIKLKGFTVEGKIGSGSGSEAYVNKCVYVEGTGSKIDGFVMEDLFIQNCGGECVRLKNDVVNAEITGNTIQDCGIHDYQFESGDKNGEGIYVGTSSSQWEDGPDVCADNIISGNTIDTNANECVDIKEGSTGNVVENNICRNQLDENSGCYDARGDNNTIRYNVATHCKGAGVRLGGWDVDGHAHGQANSVYGNDFSDVGHGAIKVETANQGYVCGNTCEDGDCGVRGSQLTELTDTWDQACDGTTDQSSLPASSSGSSSQTSSSVFEDDESTTGDGSASDDLTGESMSAGDDEITAATSSHDDEEAGAGSAEDDSDDNSASVSQDSSGDDDSMESDNRSEVSSADEFAGAEGDSSQDSEPYDDKYDVDDDSDDDDSEADDTEEDDEHGDADEDDDEDEDGDDYDDFTKTSDLQGGASSEGEDVDDSGDDKGDDDIEDDESTDAFDEDDYGNDFGDDFDEEDDDHTGNDHGSDDWTWSGGRRRLGRGLRGATTSI